VAVGRTEGEGVAVGRTRGVEVGWGSVLCSALRGDRKHARAQRAQPPSHHRTIAITSVTLTLTITLPVTLTLTTLSAITTIALAAPLREGPL
jgi:hypothetical protein